jgi:hypothetical protein
MKRYLPSSFPVAATFAAAVIALVLPSCTTIDSPKESTLDPDAKAVLEKASMTLAGAKSFSFRVQRDVPDQIAEASSMAKKADIRVSATRPDRVMAVRVREGVKSNFYYDGATITSYDTGTNTYAAAAAPATIDQMIGQLSAQWGIRPPLAGLLVSKPFETAIRTAKSGKLVGEELIGGESCNHLTFTGDGVIWDLWISAKDHLPRRFDVTITELEGSPRGVTTISDWNLDAQFSSDHFKAKVPSGATRRAMDEMP